MAKSNLTIRFNYVEVIGWGTAAVHFESDFKGNKHRMVEDAHIHDNWLEGGHFTLSLQNGKNKNDKNYFRNVTVNNNIFGKSMINKKGEGGSLKGGRGTSGNTGFCAKDGRKVVNRLVCG